MNGKRLLRHLGLSMLVAVSAMAVTASAAQANWQILVNGASVGSAELTASVPPGSLLVPGLGLDIACEGGTAAVKVTGGSKLTGSASPKFTGCDDANFGEVCDVKSTGQAAGTIVASGTGEGGMGSGSEEWYVDASSNEFTNIEYIGAECPLTEIDGRVSGKVRIDIATALTDNTSKVATILDKGIFFGEEESSLHDGSENPIKVSVKEVSGNTWALHLVGL